jgi:signal transduction histidine kinase/CheY-like chemotaxis protein
MGPVVSRVRSRAGAWHWIETVGRSIETSSGDTHIVTVTRDVSERVHAQEERRRLQERVLQAEKLEGLGVLAGGIAHDFNNLLVGIQGNAELAVMSLADDHPSRELLDQLQRAAERAAGLTRELLAYAGKARFSVEAADLAALTAEMTGLAARSVAPDVRLELIPNATPCWVEADVTQVGQVVLNLLKNAAEALPDDAGVVEVRTGSTHLDRAALAGCFVSDEVEPGRFACLEVRDQGCGMDAQTVKRVFDPFFTTKFQGRGLGLAGVLGIVRGHRGALSVDTAPGRGTTFRVYLPQIDRPAGVATPVAPRETGTCEAGTVLVIDDEPAVRAVSRRMLESAGYRVCAAASGDEGVDLARRHASEFVAVVLDLTMPGMDGDAVFAALRRIRADLPVVFTSGHSEEDMARRLQGRSRVATLPKPFRLNDLLDRIRCVADD